MTTKTIFDAYSAYSAVPEHENRSSMLISTIVRFLIEPWGGQPPKSSRATSYELIAANEFMKTLPVTLLVDSIRILEEAFKAKGIEKAKSKTYKSTCNSFVNWVQSNGYFSLKAESYASEAKPKLFKKQPNGSGNRRNRNYHGKSCKQAYALMSTYGKNKGIMCGKLIYTTDYVNNNLADELKIFEKFRHQNNNCSQGTITSNMKTIYQMLGWLHRYKDLPLEELSLKSIINFIELNVPLGKYKYHQHIFQKAAIRQEAIDLANNNINLVQEYLDFVGGHPSTKLKVIECYIAVAKFVFRNELNYDEYINAIDLPIIKRLNLLHSSLKKIAKSTPPSIAYEDKSISWEQALNVLEICRKKADARKSDCGRERKEVSIVNDLQTFLSLAFMLLIPVDRARTYYELEIGRTFVYGLYKGGRFTPASKMHDQNLATWYIHLMPNDYKTGKSYGEYWGEMPNTQFSDGKKLYEYIDTWLNHGREYEQKCNHNRFFRGSRTYDEMNSDGWNYRIKNIFIYEIDVPVSPKELRKMYVTDLNNQKATNAELKGAAKAMHHSQNMQEKIYNSQSILDSIAPVYDFNERMHKKAFGLDE
jgi:hypothetical protein